MSKQVEIPESILKRGIEAALQEMGAGLLDGQTVGGIVGLRPDGAEVLIRGARVTLVDTPPPTGIRLVATNGNRIA